jgi:tetratricopeptide (TPR) repeat protein
MAATINSLGAVQEKLGKLEEAVDNYQRAHEIRARLAQAHPDEPEYQDALASSHYNTGNLLSHLGRREEALKEYSIARKIFTSLAKTHPELLKYQGGLGATLVNLSILQREDERHEEALQSAQQALTVLRAAHEREPRHSTYRLFFRNAYISRAQTLVVLRRYRESASDWDEALRLNAISPDAGSIRLPRADTLARAGDHLRAAAEADELAGARSLSGEALYNLACVQALNAASRPLPVREKEADGYATKAVALLQRAAAVGYFRDAANVAHLHKDDDLAILRARDDYRAFIASLSPTKPKP